MLRIGTLQQSLGNRRALRTPHGLAYFKSDFILSDPGDALSPQAFLIEQEPDSTLRAHYHDENQFQVVVDGSAELGRHAVAPVSVHYASRHTGYGPIAAGPRGVSYFSLRDRTTALAHYLPEARDRMEDVPRRNVFAERIEVLSAQALARPDAGGVHAVIAPQADGLAAWCLTLPPDGTGRITAMPGGADRFYMVLGGTLRLAGEALPPLATVFTSADEAAPEIVAGREGLQLLVLQYPPRPAA
jgi:hypothetical protein